MREDVRMMRATLAMDSLGGSGGVSSSFNYDQYSTHNQTTFTAKPMRELTMGRTAIHKVLRPLFRPSAAACVAHTFCSDCFCAAEYLPTSRIRRSAFRS